MKRFCLSTLLLLAGVMALSAQTEPGFKPLFNGTDLSGWRNVNTAPSTWKVENGMIVCSGKPIGELRTLRMYQNFILELEWRHMKPAGNAGVFIWADDITARGQPFHRGIEVQVLENAYGSSRGHTVHGDIFPIHGAKMTPINGRGGSRAFPTEERSKPSPEWNHYRITCVDGDISLAVNGKLVTQGKECSPRKGYICLESEGGIVHYRNLKIKELPGGPVAPEDVAIVERGYQSLYSGVDLSGWKAPAESASHWKVNDWVLRYAGDGEEAHSSIATERHFADLGFIFDLRRSEKSKITRVLLRGVAEGAIVIDPEDPVMGKNLVEGGGWNRFEGVLSKDKLTLRLNGVELFADRSMPGIMAHGPIRLAPTGPVDFANVYVRELK